MRSDLLHVITPVANFARWKSRVSLYRAFERHMIEAGVQLHVIECTFGDAEPVCHGTPGVDHIHVQAKTALWTKENLINLAISRLPHDWKYVAWIDADVTWRKPGWAVETLYALQHFEMVQPWEKCHDLGPNDEHLQTHCSFGRQWIREPESCSRLGVGYTFAHPGYAWAATRHALESVGGLIECAILGAADHHMALALIDRVDLSAPGGLHPNYMKMLRSWQERASRHICKNIGFVPFNIEHSWHGSKELRFYIDRWDILRRHQYDPEMDIRRNVFGVFELAGNKIELKRDLWRYFHARNEDSNSVHG